MVSKQVTRLFFGVLLMSAAGSALCAASAQAQSYDDAVLMAPPTEEVEMAQMYSRESEYPPAAIPTQPPYTETTVSTPSAAPADAGADPQQSPVDYAADAVDYDQANKIVTLTGRVELTQEGRKLEADRVQYNLKDDIATAEGNVVITDITGDVHRAESVELSDKMRKGLVDRLFTTMTDGSRVWAAQGVKESEQRYTLKDASYTACKACEKNPEKRPPWRLNAESVELRKDEQRVVYRNAWLEMGGVPVFYTPYFSHPDGSVEQKSGFLTPSFGWNSDLGGFYSQPYYWAISRDMDTTFTLMPTTKEGPLLRNEFRKRWEDAYLETDFSVTHSSRTDSVGNESVSKGDELRGHFFGEGGWDINEHWRARADINVTSDEQYLRQYGFSDDYILESQVYAERFDLRDYAIIKAMAFQDIRAGDAKSDQPNVLPYGEMSFVGDPNVTLGGRWQWDSSVLGLSRDGNGQDMYRASTRLSWERQDITDLGLVFVSELGARGDAYLTTNRDVASGTSDEDDSEADGRFLPNAQLTASYPLKNNFKNFQLRVEPVVTFYAAPDLDEDDNDIPNEDSLDVQLDAGNLLDGNRYPGLDRVEDRSHVAYGLRTGLYNYNGGRLSAFLGQSYNLFDEEDNGFPEGSGLEESSSDYVGSISASFGEGKHDLSYRFQLDSESFASERHELFGVTEWGPVEMDGSYLYANGQPGTEYEDSREQIRFGTTLNLTDQWWVRGDAIYDLSDVESERGLRRSIFTLAYDHECYNVALTADRYLANASSGVNDTTIMFRIGLKNLGEYSSDLVTLSGGGDSDSDGND